MTVFAVSGVAMIGFWWNDWPGSRLNKPWTGLTDTALIVVGGVVLTIAGEAIIERPDIRAVFLATPGNGAPTTFPATLALAGAIFTTMLQLSLVCERWPLNGFSPLKSGVAGLALSWAVGVGAYFLFVNVDFVPPPYARPPGCTAPAGWCRPWNSASRSSWWACGKRCSLSCCAAGRSTSSAGGRCACWPATPW